MNMEVREKLIRRFGWSAGLVEDAAAVREERLRRYHRALERIAQGAGNPVRIAAAAMRKESDPARRG